MKKLPRYEYWKSTADLQWYFVLKGGNGETQSTSEGYTTRYNCLRGIRAHRFNALIARVRKQP